MLPARHDDDDDIYIYMNTFLKRYFKKSNVFNSGQQSRVKSKMNFSSLTPYLVAPMIVSFMHSFEKLSMSKTILFYIDNEIVLLDHCSIKTSV